MSCPRFGFGVLHCGLGLPQLGFGRGRIRGVEGVVNPGQHHPGLDDGAVVHLLAVLIFAKGHNPAGDLGPDIDHFLRLHRAGGADRRLQVAPLHLDGLKPCRRRAAAPQVSQEQERDNHRGDRDDQGAFAKREIHVFGSDILRPDRITPGKPLPAQVKRSPANMADGRPRGQGVE